MNSDTVLLLGALEPCWLWWLILSALAFILGAILGWLFGNNKKRLRELEEENRGLKAKITDLEKDYASLKYQHEEGEATIKRLRAQLSTCEADKAVLNTKIARLSDGGDVDLDSGTALATGVVTGLATGASGVAEESTGSTGGEIAYANIFTEDNLQIVEGIGPKLESVLKAAGIGTWGALAASNEVALRKVLTDHSPKYRIHNPETWPRQASLANEGKWEELVQIQKFLDGGRGDEGSFETPAKIEKMAMKIWGFSNNPEDLKVVEGIGPKIERLLKDGGINTWQELANTEVARIKEILTAAGDRYRLAVPSTWPKQAAMAAAGDWAALSEYQDFLNGGKE